VSSGGFAGCRPSTRDGNVDELATVLGRASMGPMPSALSKVGGGFRPTKPGERTGVGDEALREGEHVMATGAAAQEHSEQFGVA